MIDRIRKGKIANEAIAKNDYMVEYENNDPFPLSGAPIPKRRFMPSKHERIKINKIL